MPRERTHDFPPLAPRAACRFLRSSGCMLACRVCARDLRGVRFACCRSAASVLTDQQRARVQERARPNPLKEAMRAFEF